VPRDAAEDSRAEIGRNNRTNPLGAEGDAEQAAGRILATAAPAIRSQARALEGRGSSRGLQFAEALGGAPPEKKMRRHQAARCKGPGPPDGPNELGLAGRSHNCSGHNEEPPIKVAWFAQPGRDAPAVAVGRRPAEERRSWLRGGGLGDVLGALLAIRDSTHPILAGPAGNVLGKLAQHRPTHGPRETRPWKRSRSSKRFRLECRSR